MHFPLSRKIMHYLHLAAVYLLLTTYTNVQSEKRENIFLDPCKEIHQKVIQVNSLTTSPNTPDSFVINFNGSSSCNTKDYKLSLLIIDIKSNITNCDESLSVIYIKDQGSPVNEDGWGCEQSVYHYGDKYMRAKYVLDGTSEFTVTRIGNWSKSTYAKLVAAVYYESTSGSCDKGYFDCASGKECPLNTPGRCISNELKCNDVPSCGMKCNVDEANDVCHDLEPTFGWKDFQYVATTFLAALFFILSPTVIVFLLFYRRKVRLQEMQQRIRVEGEMRAARERSMLPTISHRANDHPPTYDDVHETIEPPPCFCAAVALSNSINQDKAAEAERSSQNPSTDTQEIQFDCTCRKV